MEFKYRPNDIVKAPWSKEPLRIIRRIYSLNYPSYLCAREGVVPEEELTLVRRPDKVEL